MASWKGFLKGLKRGAQIVGPFIGLALPGSKAAAIATTVTQLTDRAEDEMAGASGREKAAFVTTATLEVLEVTTGKNYDSPEGRALVQDLIDIDVEIKQLVAPLQVRYEEKLAAIGAYLESAKGPAQADTTA